MQRYFINQEKDCECRGTETAFLCSYDADTSLQEEKTNAEILSLYRQMKLQEKFKKCTDLESGFRDSQLYTNKRLMNDIVRKIQSTGVDYPRTFQSLTNDLNTNTILTSIQLRQQHLSVNPLAGNPMEKTYQAP